MGREPHRGPCVGGVRTPGMDAMARGSKIMVQTRRLS
jgi:hypothetical protein